MLLLVRRTRCMAVLAISNRRLDIDCDRIMTVGTGQSATQQNVVAVSSFALVTVMAVERSRGVGMTGCTISLSGCRSVMGITGGRASPVISRVVAAFAIAHRLHLGMTFLAADVIGACSRMVSGLYVAVMTTGTASQRCHGGMTGSTIDWVIWIIGISCCGMVRSTDFALVTAEAIRQIAYVGVTLGAIAGGRFNSIMVSILLGDKRMTRCTVTVCRHSFMALIAQSLAIQLRLMMARRNICAVTRAAISRFGK